MFNINWRRQPADNRDPFQEIEREMNGLRNSFRRPTFQHDNFMMSLDNELNTLMNNSESFMSLLPLRQSMNVVLNRGNPNQNQRRRPPMINEIDETNDNSQNLMSLLPVHPTMNDRNERIQNRTSRRYPQNREFIAGQGPGSFARIFGEDNSQDETHRRRRRLRNQADLNNLVFPAPRQDRQVWYDPNDPSIENRLPQIPQRVLTLAEIDRIPTQKIKDCGKSCDICLDDFKKGDNSKVLNCKHYYHVSCVDPWLKQHPTCPKCRRQVRAPPQNSNRPPRPIPPPCPVRERARAYDQQRRNRIQNENNQRQNDPEHIRTSVQDIADVQNLSTPQNPTQQQNLNLVVEEARTNNVSVSHETRPLEESRATEQNVVEQEIPNQQLNTGNANNHPSEEAG